MHPSFLSKSIIDPARYPAVELSNDGIALYLATAGIGRKRITSAKKISPEGS